MRSVCPYAFGIQKVERREMKPCGEGVVKQARTTKHPWLIADANICPEDFQEEPLVQKQTHVR